MVDNLDNFLEESEVTGVDDEVKAAEAAVEAEKLAAEEAAKQAAAAKPPEDDTAAKLKAFETAMIEERRKRQALEAQLAEKEKEEKPYLGEEYEERFNEVEMKSQQAIENAKISLSEEFAREKYADFEEKRNIFIELANENPSLVAEMRRSPNPAGFAYKIADNHLKLKEMANPDEYEKKIREKLRAELLEEQAKEAAKRGELPGSLAGTRGASGIKAQEWNGPPALGDVLA